MTRTGPKHVTVQWGASISGHWTLDIGRWTFNHSPMSEPENEIVDELDRPPLREGEDYYIENGMMVFTAAFLKNRGYCCESGCRHCPYGFVKDEGKAKSL